MLWQVGAMSSNAHAVIEVLGDHLEQYRQRVADLVPSLPHSGSDDAITALYELERILGSAIKTARRAANVLATAQ
ncbi:MAG TPA: hypothetical protein PKV27_08270 [Ilumatobacteraceae bacterium]|nr:hypothetical protein [Ilumatobacteraceae bacterium]